MPDAPYGEGVDRMIGSYLERWITMDTGIYCRFCRVEVAREDGAGDYCCGDCEDSFRAVMEARIEIGNRDLDQRGYD